MKVVNRLCRYTTEPEPNYVQPRAHCVCYNSSKIADAEGFNPFCWDCHANCRDGEDEPNYNGNWDLATSKGIFDEPDI